MFLPIFRTARNLLNSEASAIASTFMGRARLSCTLILEPPSASASVVAVSQARAARTVFSGHRGVRRRATASTPPSYPSLVARSFRADASAGAGCSGPIADP